MFIKQKLILTAVSALVTPVATATVYELAADTPLVVGQVTHLKAVYEDTLPDLARNFSLGYEEIIRANPGVDLWLPGVGVDITIAGQHILPPGPREGIVINLPEHRLYYFP